MTGIILTKEDDIPTTQTDNGATGTQVPPSAPSSKLSELREVYEALTDMAVRLSEVFCSHEHRMFEAKAQLVRDLQKGGTEVQVGVNIDL